MLQITASREKRLRHLERFGGSDKNIQQPENNAFSSRVTFTPEQILEIAKMKFPEKGIKEKMRDALKSFNKKSEDLEP